MPNYSELLTEYNNLSEKERKQLMGAVGLKARSLLTDYEKLSNIERRGLITEFQSREKVSPITPTSPIESAQFKAKFAPAEPATTTVRPGAPIQMGVVPPKIEELPERAIIESKAKDIADALYVGGSHLWHQTKQYFRSTLPQTQLIDAKPALQKASELVPQIHFDPTRVSPWEKKEIEWENKIRKRWRGWFEKKYNRANKIYAKQLIAHPELKPRKEWAKGVIETIKENPKTLLDPAYWAYVAAQSAAFTIAVMGTTLGVTALTKNPILGMAAGVAVAAPSQSQDLMDALVENGMAQGDAAQLAMPIGSMIASVEVLGDLPMFAAISKPFAKMLHINIIKGVANQLTRKALPTIAKRGVKTFLAIQGGEIAEELTQLGMSEGTIKTQAQGKDILQAAVETFEQYPETIARTFMATAPFAMVGAGAQMRTAAMRPEIAPTEITEPITPPPVEKEIKKPPAEPTTYAEEIEKMRREFPEMAKKADIEAEDRFKKAGEEPFFWEKVEEAPEKKIVEPTLTAKEKDLFEKIKTKLGEETKIESINKLSERIVKRIGVPLGKRLKAKMDLTRRAILDVKRDIRKKAQKIAKLDLKGLDPEDRAEIETIRNNIDPSFRTKKTLMRRKGTLEYVKRMKEEEQEITVPVDVLKMLYKIPLNKMTPAEFEQSYNAVMTIYQQAKLKNKLLKTLGDRDYNKTKQQLIGELKIQRKPIKEPTLPQLPKTLKAAKERRSFKKFWQTYLLQSRIPVDFFEFLDGHKVGTFSKVFWDSSEDALTNELKLVDKRKKEIKDFVDGMDISQDDLMFKFETINKKWKLPPAMKMGVYIYSQNPTARLSLGIVEGFSEQDITDVINKLTVKEKKIADEFIKLASKYYKVENDIFNKLYGFDMPREINYFPIMRDFSAAELPKYKLEEIKRLFEKTGFRQPYVERGWSIKRIPKPSLTTPPMFLDIFKVMDRHISSTSHFITHGELIRDLRKLANDKELNAEIIKTFRNKKVNQELLDYVRTIASYNETNPISNWAEGASRALRSGVVPAYIGLNVVTSFRQPISWLLGASEVGINWATAGTREFINEPRKVLNFIRETNPQIAPEHRFIERDIREMLGPEAYSKFKRFNRKKKRLFMILLRATDQPTVCAIYYGGYLKGRHRGMSHEDAVRYASRVIEKTQPMGRRKSVPKLFRGNELLRWFTMFKNQPVRIFNYMIEDIIGKRAARNISSYDALRRVLLLLVSAQAMGIISRGRFRRNKREQIIDTMSYLIFGSPIFGAIVNQQLRGFKNEFIPFRFVNDIGRIFKSKTAPTKWKYVMKTIAILNGIPWNQPYRTGVAISKLMRGKRVDLRELIWSKYQLREPKKPKVEKTRKLTPMEIERLTK